MPARLFISHPSCPPTTHLLHQTKLSFFFFFLFLFSFSTLIFSGQQHVPHAHRPLCCPCPSYLVVPMHQSPMLSTHASHVHSLPPPLPPGSTTRWVFFNFFSLYF